MLKSMSGILKFNVDGSATGLPGMAGIIGVLKDSKGKEMCLFSLCIGLHDSNEAEILTIHKACELCTSRGDLVVESDSKVTVL